mgnify:CR=1 FL=1
MKLHLLTKLFSVIAFIYLASSGQCQEKAKEDTLTASQKKEVLKANLIYKEMLGKCQKNEFANATPLAIQALKTYRELLGNKHPKTHNTIIDLGRLYLNQKEYAKSEPLLIEALKLNREIEGNKHPDTAGSLVDLGNLYFNQAQHAKAEPLYLEALKIRKEVSGNKHPDTAICIGNLASLYFNQDQYAKAEPLYLEALKIHREVLGNKHFDTANSIEDLARLYSDQAQYAKAEPLYLEALKIITDHMQSTATIQGENGQILIANSNKIILNNFLTNALDNHTSGGGYDHVLSWKGMIYRRQNLLRALQGNDPLKKELSDTIRQLATLLNSTPKPGEDQAFQDNPFTFYFCLRNRVLIGCILI